jgi:segregation and condensation protein B
MSRRHDCELSDVGNEKMLTAIDRGSMSDDAIRLTDDNNPTSVTPAAVECLLFVAGEPLTLADIARALQCDELEAETALRELQLGLGESRRGLQVLFIAGGYQLSTRPEFAEPIARLLARSASKLSRPALETAAIVAYRQPITQPEIEAVRGVACGSVLKTLLDRGLIEESGRRHTVGRPILYRTTRDFLHYFGLSDLGELPQMEEDGVPVQEILSPDVRDPAEAVAVIREL